MVGLCEIWGVKQTGPGRACNVCLEEPRALVCALDLASADWAGPVFPGHRVARGKGRDAPLAYFWPSVSSGCSAGSVLRNTAAPPSHTPTPFTLQQLHSCSSRRHKQHISLCTDTNESRSTAAPKTYIGAPTALQDLFV